MLERHHFIYISFSYDSSLCFILILFAIKMSNLILDLDSFSLKKKKKKRLFSSNLTSKDVYFVKYTRMNALREIIMRKTGT